MANYVLSAALLLAACATPPVNMHVPTQEEVAACEAQGGSIEPAYALDAYVCLLPAPSE
jgi:starvation-inducible outer membrane lipoprotein